ncbi:MAG: peptidylprolyl isomerase [Planctomycetes bacterium]|nr:peptidylprolyl isomerase [Planctomycetota bacterium]
MPRVVLVTNRGEIELELFENEAPNTVANFISLVEKGFYDGLTFHSVVPQAMARGGCPEGDGSGGPDYTIRCECNQPNRRVHFRGTLTMGNDGRDQGGSQFGILFRPSRQLDGQHTVFGRVVRGMDVLGRLQRREPTPLNQESLPDADTILEAKVIRKRNHPYAPQIVPDKEPDEMTEKIQKELMPY